MSCTAPQAELARRAAALRVSLPTSDETRRKLAYCIGALRADREPQEHAFTAETLARLLK